MQFSHFFIDRPIFAGVIAIIITLVGAFAYFGLPVSQYPDVVPPTVTVSATYPGASAETVAETVAAPIEQEINGVDDMLYQSSQSTGDGRVTITVTFKLGTDLDTAQVLVQNRVALAEPRLPEEVRGSGVVVRKTSPDFLMVVNLISPDGSLDRGYVSNYALTQIRDRLTRVDGVGDVQMFGARDYAMRVWIDPGRAAALSLTAGEIVAALRARTCRSRPASSASRRTTRARRLPAQRRDPGPLHDAARNSRTSSSAPIRDGRGHAPVATSRGSSSAPGLWRQRLSVSGQPTRDPRASSSARAPTRSPPPKACKPSSKAMRQDFPQGPRVPRSSTTRPSSSAQSVDAVQDTLLEAMLLVVLVILVFLQSWRAAIIPIVAIPVSLIGTFAVLAALGYSLNTLSLFGLVLAIGIVVDDAIVVVENVERNLEHGMTPREARAPIDGRSLGGAGRDRARALRGVRADDVPHRHTGRVLPPVRGHDRGRDDHLAAPLADPVAGARGAAAEAARASIAPKPVSCASSIAPAKIQRRLRAAQRLVRRFTRAACRAASARCARLCRAGRARRSACSSDTPAGFIPAQDQGYVLAAIQLPPGQLDRAHRRGAQKSGRQAAEGRRASIRRVMFSGFDGASRHAGVQRRRGLRHLQAVRGARRNRPYRDSNHRERHARAFGRHGRGASCSSSRRPSSRASAMAAAIG